MTGIYCPGTLVERLEQVGSILRVDAGTGIHPQDRTHLFEPFYQGTGAVNAGHAGLGLAIARRMVELQKGRIDVRNLEPTGAEFQVWLPAAETG